MRKFTWLGAPLLLSALILSACGSDDGDDPTATGTTATATTSSEATETDATATEDAATEDSTAEPSGDGEAAQDFAALAQQFSGAEFTVTYRIQGSSQGETMDGEWTWFQDPANDRLRFDMMVDGDAMTMILTEDQTLMCSEGACLDMGALGSGMPNLGDVLTDQVEQVQEEAVTADVRRTGSRSIAGVDVECYEFAEPAEDASGTVCYTDEAVPLLMETSGASEEFSMEATAYEPSVSDDDFEPPFPVVSLGG